MVKEAFNSLFCPEEEQMAHIWSDDLTSGNIYSGQWTIQSNISGDHRIVHSFFDDAEGVPWIYTGVDALEINDIVGAVSGTLSFTQSNLAFDDAAVLAQLNTDFSTFLAGIGATATVVSVVLDTPNLQYVVTFSDAIDALWTSGLTTADLVWNKTADDTAITVLNLPLRYITDRPDSLDVLCSQVSVPLASSRPSVNEVSFVVPLQDGLNAETKIKFVHTSLINLVWSRHNAPGVAVPFNNQFHLVFAKE